MTNVRLIFDNSDSNLIALEKLTRSRLNPYLDRPDVAVTKQYVSLIDQRQLQSEIPTLDMLIIAAPDALSGNFFDKMQKLNCGIVVVIMNIDSASEVLKKRFGHLPRLIVIDHQAINVAQADDLVKKWRSERERNILAQETARQEAENAGKVISPLQFMRRPHVRDVPNRPIGTVIDFKPDAPK